MLNPPITGNNDLDSWLYNLNIEAASGFGGGGAIVTPADPTTGSPVVYPFQFVHVKYADNNTGGGITDTPTNKVYWGIYNSAYSTESTNPADYTWYQSPSGFGSLTFLYYLILGGRQIKFSLATVQPSYKWLVDAGLAIDLDTIVPAATVSFNELMDATVTELKIAADAVTATKINVAALDQALGNLRPNTVSAAQIADDAVTELKILNGAITNDKLLTGTITGDKIFANTITGNKIAAETIGAGAIAAGAITTVKLEADAVTADKILAGAVTANKITVTNLAAVSANMGTLTSGTISGSTFLGGLATSYTVGTGLFSGINSGAYKFRLGNPAGNNMSWDGTNLNIVGGGTFSGNISAATGTFTGGLNVASAASGARMEIKNNVIKVFDSTGALRVQLGDLSV